MNGFKRLCLFVFGLSGVLSLVALSLVWVGPWTTQARTLITENSWYFATLEALVCISAIGLTICLLMSLFAPRNPKETIVAKMSGGEITVTRAAVVSQTRHVVEADGACTATTVRVRMGKRGNVRVFVRAKPHLPIDVVQKGPVLHAELEQGLAKICGDAVRSIDIVFTEPEQQGTLSTYVDTEGDAAGDLTIHNPSTSNLTMKVDGKDVTMTPAAEQSYPAVPERTSIVEYEDVSAIAYPSAGEV